MFSPHCRQLCVSYGILGIPGSSLQSTPSNISHINCGGKAVFVEHGLLFLQSLPDKSGKQGCTLSCLTSSKTIKTYNMSLKNAPLLTKMMDLLTEMHPREPNLLSMNARFFFSRTSGSSFIVRLVIAWYTTITDFNISGYSEEHFPQLHRSW